MIRAIAALATIALSVLAPPSFTQTPTWSLGPNEPDPFCNDPAGVTSIPFTVGLLAQIQLQVWSPDTTAVIELLVSVPLDPGSHSVIWDGRDSTGHRVAAGDYPYSLTARDLGTDEILFQEMRVAHVLCPNPVLPETWGHLKDLYRNRE